ncbi:MAG: PfkB family carbohydrate kinase [Acidobacteriota bacterium]
MTKARTGPRSRFEPEEGLYFNFLFPIWGRSYINEHLSLVGASLLAPGNLPAVAAQRRPAFTFLTREKDRSELERHAFAQALAGMAECRFVFIDDIIDYALHSSGRHLTHALSLAYMRGFEAENHDHSEVFFVILNGDKLFSDGSFSRALEICREGYRVIYHGNFRATECVKPLLAAKIRDGVLVMSSREMIGLAMDYLHPVTQVYHWDNGRYVSRIANQFYWRVDNEGMVAHFYLPHPLVVRPEQQITEWDGFVDYAFVPHAVSREDVIHHEGSSDRLASLEYASESHETRWFEPAVYTPQLAARYLAEWTNERHRMSSTITFRFVRREPSSELWRQVEQRARGVIDSINKELERYPPLDVDGHPYWMNSLHGFKTFKSMPYRMSALRRRTIRWRQRLGRFLGLHRREAYLSRLEKLIAELAELRTVMRNELRSRNAALGPNADRKHALQPNHLGQHHATLPNGAIENGVPNIAHDPDFLRRHVITTGRLAALMEKFSGLKAVVVGDLIVDEYVECDPLGMSQEDPTLVVTPVAVRRFVGGAGIVAAHARRLGARATCVSVAGADEARAFAAGALDSLGVEDSLVDDPSRPTTLKTRYRASGKTLLRVSHLRQHDIGAETAREIRGHVIEALRDADLLIFADFNYGCLPQSLVQDLTAHASREGIVMVADSQSSSQTGDVSRFEGMRLLTPTEREARIALCDFRSDLAVIAGSLRQKAKADHVVVTLGAGGALIETGRQDDSGLTTDRLPAMNSAPRDAAGAGDALLVCASLALAAGASIWEAAYLGSVGAAVQVSRIGNTPLSANELVTALGS